MFRVFSAVLVASLLVVTPIASGEFNRKLNIGDTAPPFKDLDGIDGKKHSLGDLKDKDVVVLAIICNSCPVAVRYEDRLIAFAKKYAGPDGKVAVVAINLSLDEEDTLPLMKERAKAKGFNFTYLIDPSQNLGRALGASRTPEFFVLNKDRKVVYMGAMDNEDNGQAADVNYLEAAVNATLKGEKPAVAETAPRGCGVTYAKKK